MKRRTTYVRTMPKLYGNLQSKPFSWAPLLRGLQIGAWAFVGLGVVYAIWLSPWFTVTTVTVEGLALIPESVIRDAVPTGTNILFTETVPIEQKVRANLAVQRVSVGRVVPHELVVRITEREPVLLWMSGTTASLVDRQGLVFAQYPIDQLPGGDSAVGLKLASVPRILDPKAVPVPKGAIIAGGLISNGVERALAAMNTSVPTYPVDHIEIGETAYDLLIVTKSGMRIWINLWDEPDVQVRNLARLVKRGSVGPTSQVDMRVDGRAYVK